MRRKKVIKSDKMALGKSTPIYHIHIRQLMLEAKFSKRKRWPLIGQKIEIIKYWPLIGHNSDWSEILIGQKF